MVRVHCALFLISLIGCGVDRTTHPISSDEGQLLHEFQKLPPQNNVLITKANEPGQPLLLCLTFIDKANKEKLVDQKVKFYHTSTNGDYEPVDPSDESTARLSGEAVTDVDGRIYVSTILPGDYGSSDDDRHIHTTVFGARPEAYDIHFKQYTTYMGKRFSEGSDQHFLADLKIWNETLVAFLTIEVKNPGQNR